MEKDIRPDEFYELEFTTNGEPHSYLLSPAFDRIDHYEPLGLWVLKVVDSEHGMVQAVLNENYARKLAKLALLPIINREFLYESEHELYVDSVLVQYEEAFGDDE
jgi:hypothetical protein